MRNNVIAEKSYAFALDVIKLTLELRRNNHHYELSSQLMRSGTSIGANIAEAEYAQSKKDFIAKMYIALKEANETVYWIRLLKDSEIIDYEKARNMYERVSEIRRILIAIIKTSKCNSEKRD